MYTNSISRIQRNSQKNDCFNSICELFIHRTGINSKIVGNIINEKMRQKDIKRVHSSIKSKDRKFSLKQLTCRYTFRKKQQNNLQQNYYDQQPVRKQQKSLNQILQILNIADNDNQIDLKKDSNINIPLSFNESQSFKVFSPVQFGFQIHQDKSEKDPSFLKELLKTSAAASASLISIHKKSLKNRKTVNPTDYLKQSCVSSYSRQLSSKNSLVNKIKASNLNHQQGSRGPISFGQQNRVKNCIKQQFNIYIRNNVLQGAKPSKISLKNCQTVYTNANIYGFQDKIDFLRQQQIAMRRVNINGKDSFLKSQYYKQLLNQKMAQSQSQLLNNQLRVNGANRRRFRLESYPHMTVQSRNNTSDNQSLIVPLRRIGTVFY